MSDIEGGCITESGRKRDYDGNKLAKVVVNSSTIVRCESNFSQRNHGSMGKNKRSEHYANCKLQTPVGNRHCWADDHLAMGDLLAPFPRRYSRMRNARGERQTNWISPLAHNSDR